MYTYKYISIISTYTYMYWLKKTWIYKYVYIHICINMYINVHIDTYYKNTYGYRLLSQYDVHKWSVT
jgi:hypothetical protein